jgi:hypothetical protein
VIALPDDWIRSGLDSTAGYCWMGLYLVAGLFSPFTKSFSFFYYHLALKTDGKIPVPTRSVFHFCPFVSVFAGSRFRIYGNEKEVFPSVSV